MMLYELTYNILDFSDKIVTYLHASYDVVQFW